MLLILQVPGGNPVIWGQKGVSRFYVRRAYDRRSCEFRTLPAEALEYFPPELSMPESEFQEVVRPLRTLDLFSGCGGLSHGLERSGCAKVEWAIEIDPSAADSFQVTKTYFFIGFHNFDLRLVSTTLLIHHLDAF